MLFALCDPPSLLTAWLFHPLSACAFAISLLHGARTLRDEPSCFIHGFKKLCLALGCSPYWVHPPSPKGPCVHTLSTFTGPLCLLQMLTDSPLFACAGCHSVIHPGLWTGGIVGCSPLNSLTYWSCWSGRQGCQGEACDTH